MFKKKLRKGQRYFEGWYYRLTSPLSKKSMAFIPGISLGSNSHAFIQVITDEGMTDYFKYSLEDVSLKKRPLTIKIGPNLFSTRFMQLKLKGGLNIEGFIKFSDLNTLKFNLMGPFSVIPNLPCYHKVISMKHFVKGTIKVNNTPYHFNDIGYIESDKGHSFPKGHIWIQCNTFNEQGLSLSCAISEITIANRSIPVCYAILHTYSKKYYLTTWLGAKTKYVSYKNNNLQVSIKQRDFKLTLNVLLPKNIEADQHLFSPVNGDMKSHINEILTADISLLFTKRKKILLDAKGSMCAIEVKNIAKLKN